MSSLAPLLVIFVLAWIWLDGARAREFAIELARRYCQHRGFQFLDDTVALARIGVRWTRQGLRLRRMFRFEFSLEGVGRRVGYVLLLGTQLERIEDGLLHHKENPIEPVRIEREESGPQANSELDGQSSNVVPFRRRRGPH